MEIVQSKITSKGQVTIPQSVRQRLGLHAGDTLEWRLEPEGVVRLRKVGSRRLEDLVGMLGEPCRSATVEDMQEAIRSRFRGDASS